MVNGFDERRKLFEVELQALSEKHGIALQIDAQHRRVGPQHQIEPVLAFVPIDGWVAPVEDEVNDGDSSAK